MRDPLAHARSSSRSLGSWFPPNFLNGSFGSRFFMRGKRGKAPSLDQTHDLAVRPGHIRIAALQEAPLRGMLILRAFPDEAVEYHIDLHDRKMRFRARRSVLTHSAEKVMREARSALTDSDRAHQIFIWRQFFRQTVSA